MGYKIKFGIIGCSNVARKTTIPAIADSNNAKLSRIGSRSIERAEEYASTFNCDKYGSYEEVLDDKNVDAVYISLPTSLQEEWTIKAAKNGKHILCEKSASISYKSAKNMVEAAKKNNVRILEAFMFRFHPQHKKFLELLASDIVGKFSVFEGRFGYPLTNKTGFRFNNELGGGVLNDNGCYLVSASRMILQDEPYGIMANLIVDQETGVDIHGSFYFIFPNNKVALCSFGYENIYQSNYSIWGSKSIISTERAFSIKPNNDSIIWIKSDTTTNKVQIPWVNQSRLMIDEFSKSIIDKDNGSFSYEEDLLLQARAMEGIRISHKEKRFVQLNEIN
ncbi:MAG: Gfo/Idh/MocA family oxidoreductase [Thaumarchaeota archaeon]|nr:Gfo/Idh/MocA family oxidoreductase [Nitrososphaerota archaeon]